MFDKRTFCGKRILITGAGSGIGRATAVLLGSLGAELILVGRSGDKLADTLAQIAIGEHVCISMDLCNFDDYENIFMLCTGDKKLDGMIHCAGIAKPTPIKALSVTVISEILDCNFKSFMMLLKYFSKKKYSNDGAAVVACSAVNVHYPQKYMSVYSASKAALEAVVKGMAEELYIDRKIRINAMVIGPVITPMAGFLEGDLQAVGSRSEVTPNLMGMAAPQSIAQMAAFLLDDVSAYTTGRKFYIDGGRL